MRVLRGLSASAQYDFTVYERNLYLRGDYQYQGGYQTPGTFGVAVYNPYTLNVPSWDVFSLRGGITFSSWDFNVYSNNLFNKWQKLGNAGAGISGCQPASGPSCASFTVYSPFVTQNYVRPREIGVQANYRF